MMKKDKLNQISIIHELLKQLIDILERESDWTLKPARNTIMDLIDYIENSINTNEQIDMVLIKKHFNGMFFPHAGLSEFYIQREDHEEVIRENKKLSHIIESLKDYLSP